MLNIVVALISTASWLVAGRLAYGSWAWERNKTWYCTRDVIKSLRDIQQNHHEFGVNDDPGWPHSEG
jgi:hypothetical protein